MLEATPHTCEGCGQPHPFVLCPSCRSEKANATRKRRRLAFRASVVPLTIGSESAILPLTRGFHAVIDVKDWPLTVGYYWEATRLGQTHGRTWYAKANSYRKGKENQQHILLHRLISGASEFSQKVDHIDGNGLNNRRSNLRIVTNQVNCRNWFWKRYPVGLSGYRGVVLRRPGKWKAQLFYHGKRFHLGMYDTREDAAEAYDRKAIECWGDRAVLNFPREAVAS